MKVSTISIAIVTASLFLSACGGVIEEQKDPINSEVGQDPSGDLNDNADTAGESGEEPGNDNNTGSTDNGGDHGSDVDIVDNHAPVAAFGLSGRGEQNQPIKVVLGGSDADGDNISFHINTQPNHGNVSIAQGSSAAIYVPDNDYNGSDSFRYVAFDGQLQSQAASVSIILNSNDDTSDDNASSDNNNTGSNSEIPQAVNLEIEIDTLQNPTITLEGHDNKTRLQSLRYDLVDSNSAHGAELVIQGSSVSYHATQGFGGRDSFQYTVTDSDGNVSARATVNLTVQNPGSILDFFEPQLVTVAKGTFTQGDQQAIRETAGVGHGSNELPLRQVNLSSYDLGKYEITQAQYLAMLSWALDPNGDGSQRDAHIVITQGKDSYKSPVGLVTSAVGGELLTHTGIFDNSRIPAADIVWDSSERSLSLRADWNHPDGMAISGEATLKSNVRAAHPVVKLTWYGAAFYAWALNVRYGHEQTIDLNSWEIDMTKNGYRLPTEAEWERAARGAWDGGAKYPWWSQDASTHVEPSKAWSNGHDDGDIYETGLPATSRVGRYPMNGLGFYDMSGNAFEWCADWYNEDAYDGELVDGMGEMASDPFQADPVLYSDVAFRTLRGGEWEGNFRKSAEDYHHSMRSAYRRKSPPAYVWSGHGFRIAFGATGAVGTRAPAVSLASTAFMEGVKKGQQVTQASISGSHSKGYDVSLSGKDAHFFALDDESLLWNSNRAANADTKGRFEITLTVRERGAGGKSYEYEFSLFVDWQGRDTDLGNGLRLHKSGNILIYDVDPNAYHHGGGFTIGSGELEGVLGGMYAQLADDFDVVFVVSPLSLEDARLESPYQGKYYRVSNTTKGIGVSATFNDAQYYGSDGKLQAVLHISHYNGMRNGPSLHELGHHWIQKGLDKDYANHAGYSGMDDNVASQMGGFARSSLVNLGNNQYQADNGVTTTFYRHGYSSANPNGGPYGASDLYAMGLKPKSVLKDMPYFTDLVWNDKKVGTFSSRLGMQTRTVESFIGDLGGERKPAYGDSAVQTSYKAAILLVDYSGAKRRTNEMVVNLAHDAAWFGQASDDGDDSVYNFYEASGGAATMTTGDLSDSILP